MQIETKKILRYAYPYADELELDRSIDVNWRVIEKTLRKNKVKLTFLENMMKSGNIREDEITTLKHRIENEKGRDINRRIVKLSDLFVSCGIRHLFPKFAFFYREHGDVDVLVPAYKMNETVILLQSHGYTLTDEEPSKARMSGQTKGIADTVHIHSKVHWGLEFVPTIDIWRESRLFCIDDSHHILIPSKEHCILITAAHAIFESHMICLADVFQIEGIILKLPDVNWQLLAKIADEQGWLGAFYTFLVGINAISSFLFDHTIVPRTISSYVRTLCKPLDKIMGMNVIENMFSQIYGVPLYYPISRVGMFFIGAAGRRSIVPDMSYPLNAVLHRFMKNHVT